MPYTTPNFWTERNAAAKCRQMKKRGMPDLDGGRFITLTVNRELCPDEGGTWRLLEPAEAYEMGKARLRRFIARLRKRYKIRRWFWKMELHQPDNNGLVYAHWHFWFDYGGHIPGEEVTKAWGLGRTDIRRVRRKEWTYLFKYMCKQAGDLPDWLTSMTKVRLFQTSMGFFSGNDAPPEDTPSPRQLDDIDETKNDCAHEMDTIGERIVRWTRCVVARSTSSDGTTRHKLLVMQTSRWGDLLAAFAELRIRYGITQADCEIKTQKITTTWLTQLPPCLQGYT
ncbi:hypothetical protein PXH66_03325 [Synoicihabitans lomoniglobus]|uniref:Replication-associated protein ORF2/G2P domain-containing protein n=1 Tax=Synoicihabitans lomoniglobus TaxID=2909285 RepID=A0AAF0I2Q2_9BACT|nr:hypothetical protein PXH66_03325 [Opitutaceae bacterium LMO-M01]